VRPGKAMLVLTALTTLIALWIVMSPIGTEIFRFVRPDARQLGKMLTLCLAYFVATEAVKLSYYKVFKPSPDAV
jgi:hypothetical protein